MELDFLKSLYSRRGIKKTLKKLLSNINLISSASQTSHPLKTSKRLEWQEVKRVRDLE